MIKGIKHTVASTAILLALSSLAHAEVAQVIELKGSAIVEREGYRYAAEKEMLLEEGDVIRALENSQVNLQYKNCQGVVKATMEVRISNENDCAALAIVATLAGGVASTAVSGGKTVVATKGAISGSTAGGVASTAVSGGKTVVATKGAISGSTVATDSSTVAHAEVAQVIELKGSAIVEREGYRYAAEKEMLLEEGDVIRALENSQVNLQYKNCQGVVKATMEVRISNENDCAALAIVATSAGGGVASAAVSGGKTAVAKGNAGFSSLPASGRAALVSIPLLLLGASGGGNSGSASVPASNTLAASDSSTRAASGSTAAPNSSTRAASGSTAAPDSSTRAASGSTVAPDSSTRVASGSTAAPDSSTRVASGSTAAPDSSTRAASGSTGASDSSTRSASGSTAAPDSSTRAASGSTGASDSSTRAASGSTSNINPSNIPISP